MSKHTSGPWEASFIADQGWSILAPGHQLIAVLGEDSIECDDNIEDDARRIVACVNACEGLDTGDLESTGLVSAVGYQLIELTKQRDRLLAALEDALESLRHVPDDVLPPDHPVYGKVRAAIAAATPRLVRTGLGDAHGPDITLPDGTGFDIAAAKGGAV